MKLLLKSKARGAQTLVDTSKDPNWADKYVNLDDSPIYGVEMPEVVMIEVPIGDKLVVEELDMSEPGFSPEERFAELQAIGFKNLKGEDRVEYSVLKKQLAE